MGKVWWGYKPSRTNTKHYIDVTPMQIDVAMMPGRTFTVDVRACDPIDDHGIRSDVQRLTFNDKKLLNGRTLSSYNIQDKSTLHMVVGEYKMRMEMDVW